MTKAKHQAAWRANVGKARIEVYLNPDALARLDALGGTRAEAIRGLLAGDKALPENILTAEVLEALRGAFPSAGGVDWPKAAEAALWAHQHQGQGFKRAPKDPTAAERQRRCRERKKAQGRAPQG